MSDPHLTPSEKEAVRWCVARHAGDWSAADEAAFRQWLAASEANRRAHRKVAGAWAAIGQLERRLDRRLSKPPAPARSYRSVALAALMLAVLVPFIAWQGKQWWQGVPQTLTTTRGQFKRLTLTDGSEIQLDADSEAVARIGWRSRGAELRRGAALFIVAHDEARPFEVVAGGGRIVDLGTSFDVDIQPGGVRVEVFDGRVALRTRQGEIELPAGQGAGYDTRGRFSPPVAVSGTQPAWREGQLVFRDEPLGEALTRVARYHPVQFEFAEPTLAELRLSGRFRTEDLGLFLRTLEAGFPLRAERREADKIVLTRKPPGR